jgi:hypothetical protein
LFFLNNLNINLRKYIINYKNKIKYFIIKKQKPFLNLIDYFLVSESFYPTAKLVLKNKLVFN